MSRQHCETVFAQLYRLVTFVTISHVGLAAFCPLFWAQGRSGRARCCWRVLQADRRTLLTRRATPKAIIWTFETSGFGDGLARYATTVRGKPSWALPTSPR